MNRRFLSYNWTEEDQHTYVKWRRRMAVFYGCMALLVFGLIALTKPSSVPPNEAGDPTPGSPVFGASGADMQAVTAAHADEASESLYPGRYVTNCKPAPIVGCVCETDSAAQTPQRAQNTNDVADHNRRIRDIEYLRMIEWMRLTCTAVTQSGGLR